MAFPASLDNLTPVVDGVSQVMAADVNDLQAAIEAIEAKLGIDASAVTSSLDYLIKAAADPGHTHTAYSPTSHNHTGVYAPVLGADDNYVTDVEKTAIGTIGDKVAKSLYDAYSILYADTDNTPAALTVAASTIVGRKATGGIVALTATELRAILNVADGAEVNVNADWNAVSGDAQILNKPTLGTMAAETATNYVPKSLFDANTIIYATTDNTPVALTVGANTVVGRIAGNIVAVGIDSDLSSVSASDDTLASAKAIKTALDLKAPLTSPTFATSINGSYLTASQILGTDASKNIISLPVATYPSLTELTYVKGVTSGIQAQLNGKQASDAELTAIAGLTSAANKIIRFTGSGTADMLDFKDEDNMASNSATALASQQSIKAYADLMIPKSLGSAAGDIAYWSAASTPARLAKGTALQILRMNAGATAPEWAAPSGGGTPIGYDSTNVKYAIQLPFVSYIANNTSQWKTYYADSLSTNIDSTWLTHFIADNRSVSLIHPTFGDDANGNKTGCHCFNSTDTLRIQMPLKVVSNPYNANRYRFGFVELNSYVDFPGRNSAYFMIDNSGNLTANLYNGTLETSAAITGITLTEINLYEIEINGTHAFFYVNGVLKHDLSTRYANSAADLYFAYDLEAGTSKTCIAYMPTVIRKIIA